MREKTWLPSRKQLMTILMILALIIAVVFVVFFLFLQSSQATFSLKAAIVDQLGESSYSNSTFVDKVTHILQNRGFNVEYHNETLNVSFFRELAKHNYGIIILRVHTALRQDNSTVDLFTSEEYDLNKYQSEWKSGLVTKGQYLYAPEKYYFAVTPLFIRNLEGRFPKSIVIAMGCWSLKPGCEQMAMAFLDKGAVAYVGWTHIVIPQDTDHETTRFLEMFLDRNETLDSAVTTGRRTYSYSYQNETVTSLLEFCPWSARDLKISDLISEAEASYAPSVFANFGGIVSAFVADASLNRRFFTQRDKLVHQFLITF